MAEVIVALGSNLESPHHQLKTAKAFLQNLSASELIYSSIYQSEPVGPSENDYLNAAVRLSTRLKPAELLTVLQQQEVNQGRPKSHEKWTARTIDLDIIAYNNLVIETDSLIIPHAGYTQRLFVLLPLKEVLPDWRDPENAQHIDQLIEAAPRMRISKTNLDW